MTIVVFDQGAWFQLFPQFAQTVTPPQAAAYFAMAGIVADNTDASPIACDPTTFDPRKTILNLVTAHLATLFGGSREGLVGRISDAQQGSVSVRTELEGNQNSRAWWSQTPYGLMAWTMLAPYRSAIYVPAAPCRPGDSPFIGMFGRGFTR